MTESRRSIVNKSPYASMTDKRPSCEECGAVLVQADYVGLPFTEV